VPRVATRDDEAGEVGTSASNLAKRAGLQLLTDARDASACNTLHVVPVRGLIDRGELRVVVDLKCHECRRRNDAHEECHHHGVSIRKTLMEHLPKRRGAHSIGMIPTAQGVGTLVETSGVRSERSLLCVGLWVPREAVSTMLSTVFTSALSLVPKIGRTKL
jgi:hypothetical protein